MKRTGIFALAASCAIGVTALVGGVGYASALDVAEQAGQTLDVSGVSTADTSSKKIADSTEVDPTAEPTDEATTPSDEATDDTATDDTTADDDGTVDQGSGDAVDEVDPSDPVVIKEKGDKNCRSDNAADREQRKAEREAWLAAQQAAEADDPEKGDDSGKDWSNKDWSDKGDKHGDGSGSWNRDGGRDGDRGGRDGGRNGGWGGGHGGGWGGGGWGGGGRH